MTIEALNCPNCGAGVESDRVQCQFCKTRLKTIGCPRCFGLMFEGSRFCQHCGAVAAPVEAAADESAGECPRCRVSLEELHIGETSIANCGRCDGVWMDAAAFEEVCADRERRSAVMGHFTRDAALPDVRTKISYVPCPKCGQLMNRSNFARASGVIVDICKKHGVWFDADELPAIVDFIRRGGMDIERQRERNEIADERSRLREERSRLERDARRMSFDSSLGGDENSLIRGFVRGLFD